MFVASSAETHAMLVHDLHTRSMSARPLKSASVRSVPAAAHPTPPPGDAARAYLEATNMISTRPSALTSPVFTVARAGKSFVKIVR